MHYETRDVRRDLFCAGKDVLRNDSVKAQYLIYFHAKVYLIFVIFWEGISCSCSFSCSSKENTA